MSHTFASLALVNADLGVELPTEQRLQLALSQSQARGVTQNRIRAAMAELAAGNIENVHKWLGQVAEQSPAKAVELFLELAQFTLPKVKAVAVDVSQRSNGERSLLGMSLAELEAMSEG
jgi:hypothetical protein